MRRHLFLLCFLCTQFAYGDASLSAVVQSIETTNDELKQMGLTLSGLSSRTPGSAYNINPNTTTTPWINDFFDFFKYYELRRDEKEAYLFYMNPPSLNSFTPIYSIAVQNYMFQMPFTYYNTISNMTQAVENNYIYTKSLSLYPEFLARSFINPEEITTPIDPSISTQLPRDGTVLQATKPLYSNLVYTSPVQDMVFKHFYLYCPDNYQDVCETILSSTSSGVFSSSGMGTASPNGDLNAESLLAEPGFTAGTPAHVRAKDFIQNISDPFPRNIVSFTPDNNNPGSFIPDTSDPVQIAKNIVDRSYRSLSQYVLNEIKNRRVLSVNPQQNSAQNGSISQFQFLHNLSQDRILTSNQWLTQLNSASLEALVRELVIIEASRLMMDYQQYRQNEHMEALLAAMVAQNQNLIEALNFTQNLNEVQSTINAIG